MTDENKPRLNEQKIISQISSYGWDAHHNRVYYISEAAKSQMLSSMDMATGESTALYPISANQSVNSSRHLSVNKDGSNAFYTRIHKEQKSIILLNLQ